MKRVLLYSELRLVRDSLPHGAIQRIAAALDKSTDAVREYFNASVSSASEALGVHYEQGPEGGIVELDDSSIYDMALEIIESGIDCIDF